MSYNDFEKFYMDAMVKEAAGGKGSPMKAVRANKPNATKRQVAKKPAAKPAASAASGTASSPKTTSSTSPVATPASGNTSSTPAKPAINAPAQKSSNKWLKALAATLGIGAAGTAGTMYALSDKDKENPAGVIPQAGAALSVVSDAVEQPRGMYAQALDFIKNNQRGITDAAAGGITFAALNKLLGLNRKLKNNTALRLALSGAGGLGAAFAADKLQA